MKPSVSERLKVLEALEAKWPGGLMPELTAIRAEIEAVAKEIRSRHLYSIKAAAGPVSDKELYAWAGRLAKEEKK